MKVKGFFFVKIIGNYVKRCSLIADFSRVLAMLDLGQPSSFMREVERLLQ